MKTDLFQSCGHCWVFQTCCHNECSTLTASSFNWHHFSSLVVSKNTPSCPGISSLQFSHSVVSNSLWPHEPQHARPPCSSPTPGVYPNPCPLCRWCHPTISPSVIPFSSCPQCFPASWSFQMSQLSASGGQSIGVSASTLVPPMYTQDWSPLGDQGRDFRGSGKRLSHR